MAGATYDIHFAGEHPLRPRSNKNSPLHRYLDSKLARRLSFKWVIRYSAGNHWLGVLSFNLVNSLDIAIPLPIAGPPFLAHSDNHSPHPRANVSHSSGKYCSCTQPIESEILNTMQRKWRKRTTPWDILNKWRAAVEVSQGSGGANKGQVYW